MRKNWTEIYTIDVACCCRFMQNDRCPKTKCKFHLAWGYEEKRELYFYGTLKSYYRHPDFFIKRWWVKFRNFYSRWLKKIFPTKFQEYRRVKNGFSVYLPVEGSWCIGVTGFKALSKPKTRISCGKWYFC